MNSTNEAMPYAGETVIPSRGSAAARGRHHGKTPITLAVLLAAASAALLFGGCSVDYYFGDHDSWRDDHHRGYDRHHHWHRSDRWCR